MQIPDAKPKVGFLTATSLVVGNMIGSGIFLLPATLAFYGGISIFGWVISGIGAIFLALVFGRLSKLVPNSGGPYAYTREGFGDFAGFIVSWGYWISIICTNAAIAVTLVSYLSVFIPVIAASNLMSALIAVGTVWFLTWINSLGIKRGGNMQVITTVLKIIPLLAVSIAGIFYLNIDHFQPWNISSQSNIDAVGATVALTFFAFMGMESATIPSEDVKNASIVIPRATITGTMLVLLIYMLSYVALMGLIPPESLQKSTSPFADGAGLIWGDTGRYIIGLGAIISTFGALNGWILLQGQVPYAIARDRLFPHSLSKVNIHKAPVTGLVVSSIFITILIISNFTKGLVGMFTFMILLTTVVVVFPYLFCSLAEILILIKRKKSKTKFIKPLLVGIPSFLYLMWALTGVGKDEVYYGLLLIIAGIPFYALIKYKTKRE